MNFQSAFISKRSSLVFAAALLAVAGAAASGTHAGGHGESSIGEPGVASKAARTIQVDAADSMRFTPAQVSVKKGETVRFVVTNSGNIAHEFSLGTEKELLEHYEVMKKFPDMEHDEPNKISLKPGQKGEVIWRFTHAGVVHFACLHPGHFDAGMKGQIQVALTVPALAQTTMTDGEVRKIDKETGKITIKHGAIKHLDMPPMTMVFHAKDKALLDTLQVGQKVQFMVTQEPGKMVVTEIQAGK